MPVMDGYTATQDIRHAKGHNRETPIIALTAHITAEDREKCFAAGMDDYMGKPFKSIDLHVRLSRWLHHLVSEPLAKEKIPQNSMPPCPGHTPVPDKDLRKSYHDLKNSLTAITGCAELALMHKKDPEELEDLLGKILDAATTASAISEKL